MRKVCMLAGVLLGLSFLPLSGQDAAATNTAPAAPAGAATAAADKNAAAIAEQQALDERFKQLAADIDSLRGAEQALADKLSSLKDDLQQIRAEQTRLAGNAVNPDDLKIMAAKIEEVDKKRMDDREQISEQIKQTALRLERLIADNPPPAPKPAPKNEPPPSAEGYPYTVQKGETLGAIVDSFNAKFKEKGMKTITTKQAEEANPSITNWAKVRVGQQIVIPRPPD